MKPALQPLRIGIYGGAFDPPHLAHVALAASAVQQLGLQQLYIIPTGQPWLKQRRLTAGVHRLAMARLAFAGITQAVVDDCEITRGTTTYTIDTLRELQQRLAVSDTIMATAPVEWLLLMGQDLLHSLPQWQRADELLRQVTIAVLQRPGGTAPASAEAEIAIVRQAIPHLRTLQLHLPPSPLSSTGIRTGLHQRATKSRAERLQWLQTLVPQGVAQYIDQHQLYLTPDGH